MRIEDGRDVQDDDRQERVLGHLEEDVADPGRMGQPPRRRIDADRRPPEEQGAGQEQPVLQVVRPGDPRGRRRTAPRSGSPT